MYNEQQKLSFIKHYASQSIIEVQLKGLFEKVAGTETDLDKDLSQFEVSDMQIVLPMIAGFSSETTRKAIYLLKQYIKWCNDTNCPDVNEQLLQLPTSKIMAGFEEGIERELITSPLQLQTHLDAIFRPIESNSIHNIYRAFLWLAYSGLAEQDIRVVTKNHINWNHMAIYINNDSYPIYREEVSTLMNCITLTHFEKCNPIHFKKQYLQRSMDNAIIRGAEGTTGVDRSELSKIARNAHKLGKIDYVISYTNVWTSGVFYNAYECERAGVPYDFSAAIRQYYRNKGKDPDSIPIPSRNKLNRRFINDYNRWKKASQK